MIQTYWIFRNAGDYFSSTVKPEILYYGDVPTEYYLKKYSFRRMSERNLCWTNPRALWLEKYEAKKWRITTDKNGDVHFKLLEWWYIDR